MPSVVASPASAVGWALRALARVGASSALRLGAVYVTTVVAGAAWGGTPCALALAPLIFMAWWRAPTRTHAWACATTYHVLAARSLIVGGAHFFLVSHVTAFFIVLCGAMIASIPWALCWCEARRSEPLWRLIVRVAGMLILGALPPLAAFSVTSPLLAAGIWFPTTGFVGLAALALLAVIMRAGATSFRSAVWWSAVLAWYVGCGLVVTISARRSLPKPDPSVSALATSIETIRSDELDLVQQWRVAEMTLGLAAQRAGKIVVTPEASGGLWQPAMERRWSPFAQKLAREQRSAIVGVTFRREDGAQAAGAVVLGAGKGAHTYRQRVPMPLAMWQPWSREAGRFAASWRGGGTLQLHGRRLGVLVCWEIGAPWAVLGSMLEGADGLVGLANTGWLRGTSAAEAERQVLTAWGQLFDIPVSLAENR